MDNKNFDEQYLALKAAAEQLRVALPYSDEEVFCAMELVFEALGERDLRRITEEHGFSRASTLGSVPIPAVENLSDECGLGVNHGRSDNSNSAQLAATLLEDTDGLFTFDAAPYVSTLVDGLGLFADSQEISEGIAGHLVDPAHDDDDHLLRERLEQVRTTCARHSPYAGIFSQSHHEARYYMLEALADQEALMAYGTAQSDYMRAFKEFLDNLSDRTGVDCYDHLKTVAKQLIKDSRRNREVSASYIRKISGLNKSVARQLAEAYESLPKHCFEQTATL